MKNILLGFLFFTVFSYATTVVSPMQQIDVNGTVKDMTLHGSTLLIATDNGLMKVYNYETRKFVKNITLPKVKDFAGDMVPARIFSVDQIENRYLLLSDSGKGGYVNLWIRDTNKTKQILEASDKIAAIKARFITKEQILLGLLSNEAVLYDVVNKKELFRVQLSESKFSDFSLNEDKTKAVFSCESGVLNVINTKTGKILKELKGLNVDNVYKVDFKQGIVAAAGQDRRGALYDVSTGKGTYIEGHFLIYATALSPSAQKVAFCMDEKNNITIYDRKTKSKLAELKGQKSTLNTIIFKDENRLFSASDDDTVMMWKLNLQED